MAGPCCCCSVFLLSRVPLDLSLEGKAAVPTAVRTTADSPVRAFSLGKEGETFILQYPAQELGHPSGRRDCHTSGIVPKERVPALHFNLIFTVSFLYFPFFFNPPKCPFANGMYGLNVANFIFYHFSIVNVDGLKSHIKGHKEGKMEPQE